MYGGSNLLWSELHSAQKSVLYISSNSKRCGPQETVVSLCSSAGEMFLNVSYFSNNSGNSLD
jgi:hypothetical protein